MQAVLRMAVTFRSIVAQAMTDALKADTPKGVVDSLPEALRRRFRQHGYRIARYTALDDTAGRPLDEATHLAAHPAPRSGCWACEVAADGARPQ
jgi:hypothetical protein